MLEVESPVGFARLKMQPKIILVDLAHTASNIAEVPRLLVQAETYVRLLLVV